MSTYSESEFEYLHELYSRIEGVDEEFEDLEENDIDDYINLFNTDKYVFSSMWYSWKTGSGEYKFVAKMETSHIKICINWIESALLNGATQLSEKKDGVKYWLWLLLFRYELTQNRNSSNTEYEVNQYVSL